MLLVAAVLLVSLSALRLVQDGGSSSHTMHRYFLVDVEGERFIIYVTDPETIRLAEENMKGLNTMFPIGRLAYGDGGFNRPWSWHLEPSSVRMVEVAIELCDGLPSFVERELEYWVEVVGRYCPWGGRIMASADSPERLWELASIK